MSTRSAVAVRNESGEAKGRYVHFDGYAVGDAVTAIIERDGMAKAVQTIVFDHYAWSSLDGQAEQKLESYHDNRFVAVPGYGIAYTTEQGQSAPDQWVEELGSWGTEFFHVIEPDGKVTTTSTHSDDEEN